MADDAEAPVVETPVATPDTSVASPTEAGTAPVTEPSPTPEKPQEAKPERTFTQAELDEIVEKRVGKEKRKLDNVRQEAELFKRMALERANQQPPSAKLQEQQAQPSERPNLANFKDYDEYIDAVAEYKATQKIAQYESERRQQQIQERNQSALETARRSHFDREESARTKYEDYDEVTRNPALSISAPMAEAIMHSDAGPDLYYYLGTHPEEASRISRLSRPLAVMELGKLNAKLATAPVQARPVTRAPAPINPVVGNGGPPPSDDPLPTDPIDVWMRKRNAQEAKKLGLRVGR